MRVVRFRGLDPTGTLGPMDEVSTNGTFLGELEPVTVLDEGAARRRSFGARGAHDSNVLRARPSSGCVCTRKPCQ